MRLSGPRSRPTFFLPRCSHTWELAPALEHRAEFPKFLNQGQSVGLLGWVISSSQGLYLYTNTEKHKHTQTLNIHALSGIRTHGPGFRASEDSAHPRPLGYRDRLQTHYFTENLVAPGIEAGTSGTVARNSDHLTTETVFRKHCLNKTE
jgi:hypothetical protein